MSNRIQNFLKNLSIEELREVQAQAGNLIYAYKDGFAYECRVRSYGRNWTEHHSNPYTVQELLNHYGGDDGIVDIYTNNPDLQVDNYGDTFYFPNMEDAEVWRKHRYLTNAIPDWKAEIVAWENRDSVPFNQRPLFSPYMTAELIAEREAELETLTQKLVQPVYLGYCHEEDTNSNI
jgi:hypothetical protein